MIDVKKDTVVTIDGWRLQAATSREVPFTPKRH